MNKIAKCRVISGFLCLFLSTAVHAGLVTYKWSGPTSFNRQSQTFTGFTANRLTAIIGNAQFARQIGAVQNPVIRIHLRLNNLWTRIYRSSTPSTSQKPSNNLSNIAPISFSTGIVSGIRLSVSRRTTPPSGNTFLNVSGTQFQFASIPEPGIVALLAIGLIVIGFFSNRHKFFSSAR